MVDGVGFGGQNNSLLRSLQIGRSESSRSLSSIASGSRFTNAGVDPAAQSIATQLASEVAALSQAVNNVENGANFLNTADSGLSTISDLIGRGRELAIQASNGTLNDEQRAALNREFNSIQSEIDRVSNVTEFNGQPLLNGDLGAGSANQIDIQAGSGNTPNDRINLNVIESTSTQSLNIDSLDISTAQGARDAFGSLEQAQATVISTRGQVGAATNRLSITANNLNTTIENLSASESRLEGTDIAAEISNLQSSLLRTETSLRALSIQNRQNEQFTGRILNTTG